MSATFASRDEAGRMLVPAVQALGLVDAIVLALPRGGLPVAAPIARALHAPLDVLLVRKIGAPGNPEFAIAAIAEGAADRPVVDRTTFDATGATAGYLQRETELQRQEIDRRRRLYRHGRQALDVEARTVVVVDDGVATGATVRAALAALRRQRPARLVLAIPVAPRHTAEALRAEVDDLVCLSSPIHFRAVGEHYDDFRQVSDEEATAILERANRPRREA